MFEYTCPKCRTSSAVATLPSGTISPCGKCGQSLRIMAEAGEEPGGLGSPLLFAGSALAGLTVAALLVLAWAFFGRAEAERADPDKVAVEGAGNPSKPVRIEETPADDQKDK